MPSGKDRMPLHLQLESVPYRCRTTFSSPTLAGSWAAFEHVRRLVHPTTLRPCRRPNFRQRLPETQGAVRDRQLWIDLKTTLLAIQQQRQPRLLRFAIAFLDGDQLLAAIGRCSHQNQDALTFALLAVAQTNVEVDPVCPHVDATLVLEGTLGPGLIFFLPNILQSRHRVRRQPFRIGPEQGAEGFTEIAGADAFEVEPRDQLLDTLGLAQIRRQDLRRETLPLLKWPAITDARLDR